MAEELDPTTHLPKDNTGKDKDFESFRKNALKGTSFSPDAARPTVASSEAAASYKIDDSNTGGLFAPTYLDDVSNYLGEGESGEFFMPEQHEINQRIAENQTWGSELGRSVGNLIPNIASGIAEGAGLLGALIFEWGDDRDYKNSLTEWAKENRNPFGELYRQDPNAVIDTGDSAWWFEQGFGLLESIGEFYALGAGTGWALGKASSGLAKAIGASARVEQGLNAAGVVANASTLAYTEGAMSGATVFEQVYNENVEKLGDKAARHKAAEAAAATVKFNTTVNTFLNLGSAAPFMKMSGLKKAKDFGFNRLKGEADDVFLNRINTLKQAGLQRNPMKTAIKYGSEAAQESAEELVNVVAESYGLDTEGEKSISEHFQEAFQSEEGMLSMVLGALGGVGQTGMTSNLYKRSVTQFDENGNPIVDPKTGKPQTVKMTNAQAEFARDNSEFRSYADAIVQDLQSIQDINKDIQEAHDKGEVHTVNKLKRQLFDISLTRSVAQGSAAELEQSYKDIQNLTPEEAVQRHLAEDVTDTRYKQEAQESIEALKEADELYKKLAYKYNYSDGDTFKLGRHTLGLYLSKRSAERQAQSLRRDAGDLRIKIDNSVDGGAYVDAHIEAETMAKAIKEQERKIELIEKQSKTAEGRRRLKQLFKTDDSPAKILKKAKQDLTPLVTDYVLATNNMDNMFKEHLESYEEKYKEDKASYDENNKDNPDAEPFPEKKTEEEVLEEYNKGITANVELIQAISEYEAVAKTLDIERDNFAKAYENITTAKGRKRFVREAKKDFESRAKEAVRQDAKQKKAEAKKAKSEAMAETKAKAKEEAEAAGSTSTEELKRKGSPLTKQAVKTHEDTQDTTSEDGDTDATFNQDKNYKEEIDKIMDGTSTDEDGEGKDPKGNIIYLNDKVVPAGTAFAHLTQTYKTVDGELNRRLVTTSNELNSTMQEPLLLSHDHFQPGDNVTIQIDYDYKRDLGEGKFETYEDLKDDVNKVPIGVYSNGKLVSYLHTMDWITPARVAELDDNIAKQKKILKEIRTAVVEDGTLKTTILTKGLGKLPHNADRDANGNPKMRTVSTAFPDPNLVIAIGRKGAPHITRTISYDLEGAELINKAPLKDGVPYAIVKTPVNGKQIALPLRTKKVGNQYANSIMHALDIHFEFQKGGNNLEGLSPEQVAVYEELKNKLNIDLATEEGMFDYFSLFGYSSHLTDEDAADIAVNGRVPGKTYMTIRKAGIMVVEDGLSKTDAYTKDHYTKKKETFRAAISDMYMSIRLESLADDTFALPLISMTDGTLGVTDINNGADYQTFVANHTETNLNALQISDTEWSYFGQPVITIDPQPAIDRAAKKDKKDKPNIKSNMATSMLEKVSEATTQEELGTVTGSAAIFFGKSALSDFQKSLTAEEKEEVNQMFADIEGVDHQFAVAKEMLSRFLRTQITTKAEVDPDVDPSKPQTNIVFKKKAKIGGIDIDFEKMSDDDFDEQPSEFTGDKKEILSKGLSGLLLKGVTTYKQKQIIGAVNAMVLNELKGKDKKIGVSEVYNSLKQQFETIANDEKVPAHIRKRFAQVVDLWENVQNISRLQLRTLGILSITGEKTTDADEALATITEDINEEIEDAVADVESDYEKTNFDDGISFMIDAKKTMSSRLRQFFAFVPEPGKAYLGTKYRSFDKVVNFLNETLVGAENTDEGMLATLKEAADRLRNAKGETWVDNLITLIEDAPTEVKNEILVFGSKHYANFKTILHGTRTVQDGIDSYEVPNIRVINTNRNAISNTIQNHWTENLKATNFLRLTSSGQLVMDTKVATQLVEDYKKVEEAVKANDTNSAALLQEWLEQVGITMDTRAVEEVKSRSRILGMAFTIAVTSKDGPFKILANTLAEISKAKKSPEYKNNPFTGTSAIKKLANLQAKYDTVHLSNSHKDGENKTIFSYSMNKALTHRMAAIKKGEILPELGKIPFTKMGEGTKNPKTKVVSFENSDYNTLWGHKMANDKLFRDTLELSYMDTTKKDGGRQGTKIGNMSEKEFEFTRTALFFNQAQTADTYSRAKVDDLPFISHFMMNTMSDKTTMPVLTAIKHNIDIEFDKEGKIFIGERTSDELFRIATAEIERINHHQNAMDTHRKKLAAGLPSSYEGANIAGYKDGANKFYFFPTLNRDFLAEHHPTLVDVIWTQAEEVNEGEEPYYIINNNSPEAQLAIRKIIVSDTIRTIRSKVESWKEDGIIKKGVTKTNGRVVYNTPLIDQNYQEKVLHKQALIEDRATYAAADYVINSMIANVNMLQLFTGDPALFYKGRPGMNSLQAVKSTFTNITKRLAAEIAPRLDMPNVKNETYKQIFFKDIELGSSNYDQIKKILEAKGIDPSDYLKMDIADAQEYTTAIEHVHILYKYGKLTTKEYNNVIKTLEAGKDLSDEMLGKVLQPMKPVYADIVIDQNSKIARKVYIKSSSFPLLPQLTRGLALDKVRRMMEGVDENDKPILGKDGKPKYAVRNAIQRAAFNTAVKVGSSNSFDWREDIDTEGALTNSIVLPRSGFGIQQELPYSDKKTEITKGSQETALLFVNILDVDGFNYNGETYKGAELKQVFADKHEQLYKLGAQQLLDEVTNEDGSLNMQYLQRLLLNEAKDKGYPISDIQSLGLHYSEDRMRATFSMPLWANNSANKFESLITSIISNRVSKLKSRGFSAALGSDNGINKDLKEAESAEGQKLLKESGIIFTDSFEGELQPMRIVKEDGERKVLPAQVVTRMKFTDNNGKVHKITDFTKEVDGKQVLDTDLLPKDLLEGFGFRIPTQGHNSMAYVEIVGFLPDAMGDLLIAPRDFIVQMGSDFDIDKLYSYLYNTTSNYAYDIDTEYHETIDKEFQKFVNSPQAINKTGRKVIRTQIKGYDVKRARSEYAKSREDIMYSKKDNKFLPAGTEAAFLGIERYVSSDGTDTVKSLQDDLLDIRLAVLRNPDATIQALIREPLVFGKLKSDGKTDMLALVGERESRESQGEIFMGITDQYQKDAFFAGRAGQIGIGVFSIDSKFNALAQGKNLSLIKPNPEHLIDKTAPAFIEDPIGFKMEDGSILETADLSSPFSMTEDVTKDGKVYKRYKSQIIAAFQSASVDNANEQILQKLNINNTTFNAFTALNQLGWDEQYSVGIMAQDSMIELVKRAQSLKDSIENTYTEDPLGAARQASIDKFILNDLHKGDEAKSKAWIEDVMKNPYLTLKEMQDAITLGKTSSSYHKVQYLAMHYFSKADSIGEELRTIKYAINTESKHLGKSFIETTYKQDAAEGLSKNTSIANVSSLLKGTINGYATEHALVLGNEMFSKLFPYEKAGVKTIMDEVLGLAAVGKGSMSRYFDTKRLVFNAMKSYLWSSNQLGLFDTTSENERNRLLYDKSVIKTKEVEFTRADGSKGIRKDEYRESIQDSLATRLHRFKLTPKGQRNDLITLLTTDIDLTGKIPSTVSYNAAAGENMDESIIHASLVELLLDSDPEVVMLAQDLIGYSVLTGAAQSASNYIKYLPPSYFEAMGVNSAFRTFDQNLSNLEIFGGISPEVRENNPIAISKMAMQIMQHNPELAPKLAKKNVPSSKGVLAKSFTTSEGSMALMVAVSDAKAPKKYRLYKLVGANEKGDFIYKQVDTAGHIRGLAEYNPAVDEISSGIEDNRVKGKDTTSKPLSPGATKAILSTNKDINNTITTDAIFDEYGLMGANTYEGTGMSTISNALSVMEGKSEFEGHKVLSRVLNAALKATNIPIDIRTGRNVIDLGTKTDQIPYNVGQGVSRNRTDEISVIGLNLDRSENKNNRFNIDETILHELTHTLTVRELRAGKSKHAKNLNKLFNGFQSKFIEGGELYNTKIGNFTVNKAEITKFNKLYEESKRLYSLPDDKMTDGDRATLQEWEDMKRAGALSVLYPLTNVKEFVAIALTSPDFQKFLNSVEYTSNEDKTIWEKLVSIITEFLADFSIGNTGEKIKTGSMLEATIAETLQLFDEKSKGAFTKATLENIKTPSEPTPTPIIKGKKVSIDNVSNNRQLTLKTGQVITLTDGQDEALTLMEDFLKSDKEEFLLMGEGGTGKTTIISHIARNTNLRIGGVAPTHKAKKQLSRSLPEQTSTFSPIASNTLASMLAIKLNETTGEFTLDEWTRKYSGVPIQKLDLIILDEASMISSKLYEQLLKDKKPSAKIIYMGDDAQLPPVGDNKVSPIFDRVKDNYRLTEVKRQAIDSPILNLARTISTNIRSDKPTLGIITNDLRKNDVDPVSNSKITFVANESSALNDLVSKIKEANEDVNYAKAVTYNNQNNSNNQSVKNLNLKIRQKLWGDKAKTQFNVGELVTSYDAFMHPKDPKAVLFNNSEDFFVTSANEVKGKKFKVTAHSKAKGSRSLEVEFDIVELSLKDEDGNTGPTDDLMSSYVNIPVIANSSKAAYKAMVDSLFKSDPQMAYALMRKFANMEYGYAVTSHKSQGSTYKNVYVFEDNILGLSNKSRGIDKLRSLYVGVSRASESLTMISGKNNNIDNSKVDEKFRDVDTSEGVEITGGVYDQNTPTGDEVTGHINQKDDPGALFDLGYTESDEDYNDAGRDEGEEVDPDIDQLPGEARRISDRQYHETIKIIYRDFLLKPKKYWSKGKQYQNSKLFGSVQGRKLAGQIERQIPWIGVNIAVVPDSGGKVRLTLYDNRPTRPTDNGISELPGSQKELTEKIEKVDKGLTPTQKLISYKKGRISTINRAISKYKNDPKKENQLLLRKDHLEKEIDLLQKDNSLEAIVSLAKAEMADVRAILKQPQLGDEDFGYISNILHDVLGTVEFWADLEPELFTPSQREPFQVTEKGPEGETITVDKFSKNVSIMKMVVGEVSTIKSDVAKLMRESLMAAMTKDPSLSLLSLTNPDDLKAFTDISSGVSLLMDIRRSGNEVLSAVGMWMSKAVSKTNDEVNEIFNSTTELTAKVKATPEFKTHGWDLFAQVTKDGKKTGDLASRFSQDYHLERDKRRKAAAAVGTKAAWDIYYKWKKENEIIFDFRKIFREDNTGEFTFTEAERDAHLAELKEILGERGFEKRMEAIEQKYAEYKALKKAEYSRIEDLEASSEEKNLMRLNWKKKNSPFIYADSAIDGKANLMDGKFVKETRGYRYTESVPRKIVNGKYSGWYDEKFDVIEHNKDLLDFYNHFTGTVYSLSKFLPDNFRDDMQVNTLPELRTSLAEDIFKEKNLKQGFRGISDHIKKAISTKDMGIDVGQDVSPITGEPEPTFPLTMLQGNMSAEQKSYQLDKVIKVFSTMAVSYKHKSRVEDLIKMANTVIQSAVEVHETPSGKLKQSGAEVLKTKEDLTNMRQQLSHAIAAFYGQGRKPEGQMKGEKYRVYTWEEKQRKKLADKAIEELTDKYESAEITEEEYDTGMESIRQEYNLDELGRNITGSAIGDSIIKYVQLKGMGWNVFSATTNMIFGNFANMIHANGGEDFTLKQMRKAFTIMLNSMGNAFTAGYANTPTANKVRNLMVKFDVLKEFNEEAHKTAENSNVNKKGIKKLAPYELQRSSEYFVQGQIMVAYMMNTKLDHTDENSPSLWEAYGEDGTIKEEYGEHVEWEGDFNNEEHNNKRHTWKVRLDAIIKTIHGNYDPASAVRAKGKIVGRFLMQFRSWIPEGFQARFEAYKPDHILGRHRKGRYNTMADLGFKNSLITLFKQATYQKDAFDLLKTNSKEGHTEVDIANMRKNLAGMTFTVSMFALGVLLKGMTLDDDDEEGKLVMNLLINEALRLETDLTFFNSISSFEALSQSAIPAFSAVNDFGRFAGAAIGFITGEDDRITNGPYAGESKLGRSTMKVLPMTSSMMKLYTLSTQQFDKN
jgi:exodeoxyribonuclease-5